MTRDSVCDTCSTVSRTPASLSGDVGEIKIIDIPVKNKIRKQTHAQTQHDLRGLRLRQLCVAR